MQLPAVCGEGCPETFAEFPDTPSAPAPGTEAPRAQGAGSRYRAFASQ